MLWFWGSIFLLALFAKVLGSWHALPKGERHIWSGLGPTSLLLDCSVLHPPWAGWHRACWWQGRSSQGVTGSPEERQPLQPPKSFSSLGALLAGAGEMRRTGEGSRGNGWSCLASLAGLPSPSPTLYVSLEKLLRGGRHSNTEGPATGAASVGGSSTFCMSQQRKGGRSYPLCNVCIFQDVSEEHRSKMWHIRAQKLE